MEEHVRDREAERGPAVELRWDADVREVERADEAQGGPRAEPPLRQRQGQGGGCADDRVGGGAGVGVEPRGDVERQDRGPAGVGPPDEVRRPPARGAAQAVADDPVEDQVRRLVLVGSAPMSLASTPRRVRIPSW